MMAYIAEFIGTMLLILLGDGVVANVSFVSRSTHSAICFLFVQWGANN